MVYVSVLTFFQNQGPKGNNDDQQGTDNIQPHGKTLGHGQKHEPALWIYEP